MAKELSIGKRIYGFSILAGIFVCISIVASKIINDLYIILWIFIPLAIILSIIGWIIMKPVRKELKKGKVKTSLDYAPEGLIKIHFVLGYTLGISWLILGLLLLGIVLFTNLSDSAKLGGTGAVFSVLGITALFAARELSKGKIWGFTGLFIALLVFLLFIVSLLLFLR